MNILPSDMKENYAALRQLGETMPVPTGRFEKRIARAVTIEVCPQNEPMLKERTLTENVSPQQHVLLIFPKEGVRSEAQIVYCERVTQSRFAVGLELSEEVELWARRY